jgi:hypothetical protein
MKLKILIIGLLLLLPLVSAEPQIFDMRVYGNSNANNFLAQGDNLYVEGYFSLDGAEILPTQVTLDGVEMDSCVVDGSNYFCTYSGGFFPAMGGEYDILVQLRDDQGVKKKELTHTFWIDEFEPSIDVTFENDLTNGQPFDVNYAILDSAFIGSDLCSGIKKLTVQVNGVADDEDFATKPCSVNNVLTIIPDSAVSQEVCFKVEDWAGNLGDFDCYTFDVDNVDPDVIDGSLDFDYLGNGFLTLNTEYNVDFSFQVVEENFEALNVLVDFSDLNPQYGHSLWIPNTCVPDGLNTYLCTFPSLPINLLSQDVTIGFNVTDLAGNNIIEQIPFSFNLDDMGPEAEEMLINGETENIYVGATIPKIEVRYHEEGQMIPSKAFIDAFGTEHEANTCNMVDDKWICEWLDLPVPEGITSGEIVTSMTTTDALDNTIVNSLTLTVNVERTPPVLINYTIWQEEGPFELNKKDYYFECIPIHVRAEIEEEGPLMTARVIPLDLMSDEILFDPITTPPPIDPITTPPGEDPVVGITDEDVTTSCLNNEDGTFTCDYIIPCALPGYYQASFIFEDIGKNKIEQFQNLTILDLLDIETNYFYVENIQFMPSAFDVATAPLINHRLLTEINLEKYDRAVGPMDEEEDLVLPPDVDEDDVLYGTTHVELLAVLKNSECEGPAAKYIRDYTVIDSSNVGIDPLLEFILKKEKIPNELFNLSCNISIFSLITTADNVKSVNLNPEIESFDLVFDTYISQLPDEVVNEKIESIKAGSLASAEWISGAKNVLGAFDFACDLWKNIALLLDVFEGIKVFYPQATFVDNAIASLTASLTGENKIGEVAGRICGYVTCERPLLGSHTNLTENYAKLWTFNGSTNAVYDQEDVESWLNPRSSLISSIATFCLPGIIDKAEEGRQIECAHAYCIQEMSKQGNLNAIIFCDEMHSFSVCKFWMGELTFLVPPMKLIKEIGGIVEEMSSNWVSTGFGGLGLVCETVPGAQGVCKVVKGLDSAIKFIDNLIFIKSNWESKTGNVNYCEMIQ